VESQLNYIYQLDNIKFKLCTSVKQIARTNTLNVFSAVRQTATTFIVKIGIFWSHLAIKKHQVWHFSATSSRQPLPSAWATSLQCTHSADPRTEQQPPASRAPVYQPAWTNSASHLHNIFSAVGHNFCFCLCFFCRKSLWWSCLDRVTKCCDGCTAIYVVFFWGPYVQIYTSICCSCTRLRVRFLFKVL